MTARLEQERGRFRDQARVALADAHRQDALAAATSRLTEERASAWGRLDDLASMRRRAHDVRMDVVDNLEAYLDAYCRAAADRGTHVYRAADAAAANEYVARVCRDRGARLAVKSKSMLSEEVGLNEELARTGVQVVESDLGEYVVQLAGGEPQHILAPAIDLTAEDVARLFGRDGPPVAPELTALAGEARRRLRDTFLNADVGITGVNFAVAETGSLCLVTNEGNGGLVTALPPVHIALLGLERLVPTLAELALMLELLARSATGQPLTTYTRLLTGPRRAGEPDGPEELHVVVVDNGRTGLLRGRYREMLACIRCGACLNVCPVYRKTGGAAYGPVYSGPMGAVLVPLLAGLERAAALPHASSLCGACTEACPVGIPLHDLLLDLRRDLVGERVAPRTERLAFAAWSLAWSRPAGYRLSTALARLLQRLARHTAPGRAWAHGRDLPRLGRRYRDR